MVIPLKETSQEINGATGPKKVKLQKEKLQKEKKGGIVDAVVQFCSWFKQ